MRGAPDACQGHRKLDCSYPRLFTRLLDDVGGDCAPALPLSLAKTLQGHKSRPVTMLQSCPLVIHFKRILDSGEGQVRRRCRHGISNAMNYF
jgi:hypothetical protein